ncbi:glycerate kinase type-2 family protein [Magnetovibrio blakemorei]|uniref:Hydroxypyruvate reductase n=1 Tax=Magnetovibrio blakemorei TaxID=28181 RepID=A0A1E5Q7G4_9PROT|nr:glycerate kinase [Magnetovibrio blakemorei]OEJ67009.1 hydroxypyruvate reductase [Magnetovibrio blakemorei]
MTNIDPDQLLRNLFAAATEAALPERCIGAHLPPRPKGRTVVIGAGKAAAAMARAVEEHWDGPLEGLVVTRYGHAVPTQFIEVVEASHPMPDQAGVEASRRILDLVSDLSADDLVLCLISGGGSALMSLPTNGLTLHDKQDVTNQLLRCGATITEINCVRKHLSAIKGGRLAMACYPAKVVSLIISDVPGDDLSSIASGATVADPSTYADAIAVFEKYAMTMPPAVAQVLSAKADETPKPGDARFALVENTLIATPQMSLQSAAQVARDAGYTPMILSDRIEGEARDVAVVHSAIAYQVVDHGQPLKAPAVILSGGETTVTVRGTGGRGGRNTEFLLALAIHLDGLDGVHAIACDTDGIDGSEDNSGAVIHPDTLARAAEMGLDAKAFLANNDAFSFFSALNDLVMSGPTLTNVNDFRAIVIECRTGARP